MKIKIICIGKIKEKYLTAGMDEFLKRLKVYANIEIIELVETKLSNDNNIAEVNKVIDDEGKKILKQLNDTDYIISLDVDGKNITNEEYVEIIENACLNGYSSFCFIIGGSYGLSNEIKEKSFFKWSFSNLVFTHQMIRLILLEQIYRGFKIMKNEPYHK